MNLKVFLTALCVMMGTSGCTSQISAVLNRDLRTDTASFGRSGPHHIVISTTGERRMAFFSQKGRLCPENFPDASRSLDTKSTIDVSGKLPDASDLKAKIEDAFKTALTVTNTRTEASDIVGRLGAIICVGYLNEAIGLNEYKDLIKSLVTMSTYYLMIKGGQPQGGSSGSSTK